MKDTVAGLEMYAIGRSWRFGYGTTDGGFEVLLYRNDRPRRLCFCKHEDDARAILKALVDTQAQPN